MSIRLYGWPRSTASRVHWALEELGVGYEYVTLDHKKGENRAPAYLAINPGGKVPGLVDGGQAYFESAAIILHLGETYGRERGLWPAAGAGAARADALCWTVWGTTELHVYMMQWLYHGVDTPVSYAPAGSQQGDRRLQPRPVPAPARRAGGAARGPRLHPGRGVLARRHPGRVGAARRARARRQRRGPQEHRRLAGTLPRPPGLRAHRRRRGRSVADRGGAPRLADVRRASRSSRGHARASNTCRNRIVSERPFSGRRSSARVATWICCAFRDRRRRAVGSPSAEARPRGSGVAEVPERRSRGDDRRSDLRAASARASSVALACRSCTVAPSRDGVSGDARGLPPR